MKSEKMPHPLTLPLAIFIAVLIFTSNSLAETVLHAFRSGGGDGLAPYGRLISDAEGNLYGTTELGGTSGAGVVFELTKSQGPGAWTETILYNFTGGSDGSRPWGGVIFDSAGNLYGTTFLGGTSKRWYRLRTNARARRRLDRDLTLQLRWRR